MCVLTFSFSSKKYLVKKKIRSINVWPKINVVQKIFKDIYNIFGLTQFLVRKFKVQIFWLKKNLAPKIKVKKIFPNKILVKKIFDIFGQKIFGQKEYSGQKKFCTKKN